MNISISVGAVFNKLDFVSALAAVKQAGFSAFEFWGWWDKDMAAIKEAQETLQLTAVACCTRFISLVDPASRPAYLKGLEESIQAAKKIGCSTLISQVGNDLGTPRDQQHQSLVAGLKASARLVEKEDFLLVFEPLNSLVDHPGYYLTSSEEAFDIVDEVGSPNIRVLYDIYHQQISEGHLIHRITQNIDKIGHFHAAGNPGRHELDRGEINYDEIFRSIDETGFNGYVGLEYTPMDPPEKGLKNLLRYLE